MWGYLMAAVVVLGSIMHPALAHQSTLYGMTPDQFIERHWEGQNKFLTTIVAAERDGYLLDYHSLAQALSPWLTGKDSMVGEDVPNQGYDALLKRLKVKQSDFVRFEMIVNKAFIYDPKQRSFAVCLNERDVFSNESMRPLRQKVEFRSGDTVASGRMLKRCKWPALVTMTDADRMDIMGQRALHGVSKTRPVKLVGELVGVRPTRSIPSVMGYRWLFHISVVMDSENSFAVGGRYSLTAR